MTKKLLYTAGEPAGIGVDLAIVFAQDNSSAKNNYQLITVADPDTLLTRAKQLALPLKLVETDVNTTVRTLNPSELAIIPITSAVKTICGKTDPLNSSYVLKTLDIAIEACLNKNCHAMVTGPIQKSVINDAGIVFSGHTEYLADKTQTPLVVMMLVTEGLRVALATTHIPLKQVADTITESLLRNIIHILHKELKQRFEITDPTILVCGLNPHAGESGHLGKEEIEVITPTLNKLCTEGLNCIGPLPADTLFTPKYLEQADAVLAMYHDQGLPVLKYKGFGAAANITLGLPIIRTSVDHGTALDLAGTGNIDIGSLHTAINAALSMNSKAGRSTDE